MITTTIRNCELQAQEKPVMRDNKPEFFAKLLYVGGSLNVRNPEKFKSGPYSEITVESRFVQGATLKQFQGEAAKAMSTTAAYFGAIVSAKAATPAKAA